jgi:hypothetical protein
LFAVLAGHVSSGSLFTGRKKAQNAQIGDVVLRFSFSAHRPAYFVPFFGNSYL